MRKYRRFPYFYVLIKFVNLGNPWTHFQYYFFAISDKMNLQLFCALVFLCLVQMALAAPEPHFFFGGGREGGGFGGYGGRYGGYGGYGGGYGGYGGYGGGFGREGGGWGYGR